MRLHFHSWCESAVNGYGISHEERCFICGARRHRFLDASTPLGKSEPWFDGPHPGAQKLRETGKVETDSWSKLLETTS
jgi:hypothetical protein